MKLLQYGKGAEGLYEIEFLIEPDQFELAVAKTFRQSAGKITVPGFRRGKAPRKLIENYYSEAVFYNDAADIILPEAYDAAVKEAAIFPVDRPEVDVAEIGGGKDFVFTAEVTVKPEVELGEYKQVEAVKNSYPVSDKDIDAEIDSAAQRIARWVDVEREVADKDRTMIDYSGSVDGVKFEGGTADNQMLEIGSGRFIPGFEEQLIGMKKGEERDITVTFPAEYHEASLAGKEAVFHVKVNEIKAREMPEIDDEFAKDVSEFDTLAEYKADIEKNIKERNAQREKDEFQDAVVGKAVENAVVDVPDCMVETQLNNIMRDFEMQLYYQGIRFEDYMKMTGMDANALRESSKGDALRRVKTTLVLEAIGKAEDIKPDEAETEKEYERLCEGREGGVEAFKATLSDEDREYIAQSVITRKTIEFLEENAKAVEPAQKSAEEEKA